MITLNVNEKTLQFEHSLISLSDWEAEYEKPFFSRTKEEMKSEEELTRYFEFMLVKPKNLIHLVRLLNGEQRLALVNYIASERTATTVREIQQKGPSENVTSELVYYWLVAFKIPFKPTDEWHLNRLLMLVKVCGAKQAPAKKTRQSRSQIAQDMRTLNEKRLKELGTTG